MFFLLLLFIRYESGIKESLDASLNSTVFPLWLILWLDLCDAYLSWWVCAFMPVINDVTLYGHTAARWEVKWMPWRFGLFRGMAIGDLPELERSLRTWLQVSYVVNVVKWSHHVRYCKLRQQSRLVRLRKRLFWWKLATNLLPYPLNEKIHATFI